MIPLFFLLLITSTNFYKNIYKNDDYKYTGIVNLIT